MHLRRFVSVSRMTGFMITSTWRLAHPWYTTTRWCIPTDVMTLSRHQGTLGAKNTGVKKTLVDWAKKQGLDHARSQQLGGDGGTSLSYLEPKRFWWEEVVAMSLGRMKVEKNLQFLAPFFYIQAYMSFCKYFTQYVWYVRQLSFWYIHKFSVLTLMIYTLNVFYILLQLIVRWYNSVNKDVINLLGHEYCVCSMMIYHDISCFDGILHFLYSKLILPPVRFNGCRFLIGRQAGFV